MMRLPQQTFVANHAAARNTSSHHGIAPSGSGVAGIRPQQSCQSLCRLAYEACVAAGGGQYCNLGYAACLALC